MHGAPIKIMVKTVFGGRVLLYFLSFFLSSHRLSEWWSDFQRWQLSGVMYMKLLFVRISVL